VSYGIHYGVKQFGDLLSNRHFILKTDIKNLTYINVTLTGMVLRWKLYLQDNSCMFLGKKYINSCLMLCLTYVRLACL